MWNAAGSTLQNIVLRGGSECGNWKKQICILGPSSVDPIRKRVYYPGRNFSSRSGLGCSAQAVIISHWFLLLLQLSQTVAHLWPFCIGRFQPSHSISWQFSVCLGVPVKFGVLYRGMGIFLPLSSTFGFWGRRVIWGAGKWHVNAASVCWPSYGIACCKEGAAPSGAQPGTKMGCNQRCWWLSSLWSRHSVHQSWYQGARGVSPRPEKEPGPPCPPPQPWLRLCGDFWLLTPLQGVAKIRQRKQLVQNTPCGWKYFSRGTEPVG